MTPIQKMFSGENFLLKAIRDLECPQGGSWFTSEAESESERLLVRTDEENLLEEDKLRSELFTGCSCVKECGYTNEIVSCAGNIMDIPNECFV
jgi:hypothetical protein